jgi:hypothetical protein
MKLTQKVLDSGIYITVEFVPFSKSRNANPNAKTPDKTLNWKVSFTRNGQRFASDYQQGIGHCPSYKQNARYTIEYCELIDLEVETGRKAISNGFARSMGKEQITLDTDHVIECLIMDSSVLDYPNFESWAGDFGYDKDSRKAEAIYQECLKQALEMQALFGRELITALSSIIGGME